jgi:glycosyltransferase involved in cell wall biosynthesis
MKLASYSLFTSMTEFKRLNNFRPYRADIVFNCVDEKLYFFDSSLKKEKIILMISNLTKENVKRKMILETIIASKSFLFNNPDYKFIICGKWGDGLLQIKELINSLGLDNKIILKGSVTLEDKLVFLKKAKIYLQPTIAEGFGLAILEAQACGTPVITSFEPCINEIFSDSVFRINNIHDLNEPFNLLTKNPHIYQEYLYKGIQNSKKYSKDIRAEKIQKIIMSL